MAPRSGIIRSLSGIATAMTNFQNRLYTPPKNTITNVNQSNWPNPNQPVAPIGPKGSEPLGWPFWEGQNLTYTPRPDAEYTAHQLRELAMYPLARILIEQVKDSICSMSWSIKLKRKEGESNADRMKREAEDPIIKQLMEFFSYPDQENSWATWIRPFLDDMLVIDAGAILIRKTFGGKIAQLRVIPGANISRYIDDNGFTPMAPEPAYAQLWEGIPRVNLTTDQLIYRPYNIVPRSTASSHLYGCSPTEQMAEEIKIGIERLKFVLLYYTEGSTPGVMRIVPPGVTPDRISEAMQWESSEMAGNLAKRRQVRYYQGFREEGDDQIVQLKEPILSDAFDDLHIRKLAYAYGASAQRLLKMMNRAASESNQDAAEEEGTLPWVKYLKDTHDLIIQKKMGYNDYEWVPDTAHEADPKTEADILTEYVKTGQLTINESRKKRDLDPDSSPEADVPMVMTATGFVPLAGSIDRTQVATDNATTVANKPVPSPAGPPTASVSAKGARIDWYKTGY